LGRLGVPLLGVLPTRKALSAPNLTQIAEEIGARWLNGRGAGAQERIEQVVIGAMTAKGVVDVLRPGVLLVMPGDRDDLLFATLSTAGLSGRKVVSGIVLTGHMLPHPRLLELLAQTPIPVVAVEDEPYDVASKINSMTIKTQPQDADKIPIIKQLVMEHIDLGKLLTSF
jgi:BioD-like phosphotransacetylase family protein